MVMEGFLLERRQTNREIAHRQFQYYDDEEYLKDKLCGRQ
jgi:hypothetical protein